MLKYAICDIDIHVKFGMLIDTSDDKKTINDLIDSALVNALYDDEYEEVKRKITKDRMPEIDVIGKYKDGNLPVGNNMTENAETKLFDKDYVRKVRNKCRR